MRALFLLLLVAAAGGLVVWKWRPDVVKANAPTIPATTVKRGDVVFTIAANGELVGGNTQMLTVPMTGGQPSAITMMRQNGELVQAGDTVVQFDTTEQEYRLREAEADLAEAEQQIIQSKAEAEAKEEETRYQLLQAEADVKLAQTELGRAEVLPKLVLQQNQLAYDAAVDKLEKIRKDFKNRLEAATKGIAIQEAAYTKAKVKAETARKNIDNMTLKAKAAGYVAIQGNDEGNLRWGMYMPPYQVGDIARPGKAVAQIPDLNNWEATARIGELDRGHIAEKQAAELQVVALPGLHLAGNIKTIGGTTGPPWDRHFDCRVRLDGPTSGLRPGMSVRLKIVTGTLKGALWIPAQALFEADGRKFVYARSPGGFTAKDVELVRRSESQVVVKGIPEGQLVAMANPDQSVAKEQKGGAMQAIQKK
jgi:multidrug efflux pump subunit AcrA (membrane-fusion protein)